jgi:SAM-dependent methyltransferase
MTIQSIAPPEFDQYSADYDRMLAKGLAIAGEHKEHFARGRINWLQKCLERLDVRPRIVMDFGCGTGSSVPLLEHRFAADAVIGVDPSRCSIERAEHNYGAPNRRFQQMGEYTPQANIDLVYCNGVFHHIPVAKRAKAAAYVWRALKPGGYWAFWENNPWNPGTRFIMSRVPFDRDAVPLCAAEARHLLQVEGFHIVRTDYLFIFPKFLKTLRWIEPALAKYPFGGQYLVLGRKSVTTLTSC